MIDKYQRNTDCCLRNFYSSTSELLRLKKKMDEYNRSSSKHDHVLRELQTRESDLMEVLNAKDSQLAVLRIRLEEADKNLQSSKKEMDRLQGEKSR